MEVAIGEIDRMSRLVDSLLRLAREDHGDAVPTPVDVGDLAAAVVDRSRVLGERDWRFALSRARWSTATQTRSSR